VQTGKAGFAQRGDEGERKRIKAYMALKGSKINFKTREKPR